MRHELLIQWIPDEEPVRRSEEPAPERGPGHRPSLNPTMLAFPALRPRRSLA